MMLVRMHLTLVVLACTAAACATASRSAAGRGAASAELRDAKGNVVGSAALTEYRGGVRVSLESRGISPGSHGVHVHAVGACDTPDFKSAGDHFNPHGRRHGTENPQGPHAGDLPNLHVGSEGTGRLVATTALFTLTEDGASLFDADGSALVVHAGEDDLKTDPSGNSGDRIACGEIREIRTSESGRAGY